jgi:hypothetical protein
VDLYYKALLWVIFWRKLKKKILLRFFIKLYSKAILWVIFWKKIKFFLRSCMHLYYKAIWVIFWRKLKKKFFCVFKWNYTIML